MLSLVLALQLRDAGLRWSPVPGDRFCLPHRGMDADVFVVADMTVQVLEFPTGRVIAFNGVTEWALDSVTLREALWLPSEEQLRQCLGGLFARLDGVSDGSFAVTLSLPDGGQVYPGCSAADAYGTALLAVLRSLRDGRVSSGGTGS